jgi:hypothetical protein
VILADPSLAEAFSACPFKVDRGCVKENQIKTAEKRKKPLKKPKAQSSG